MSMTDARKRPLHEKGVEPLSERIGEAVHQVSVPRAETPKDNGMEVPEANRLGDYDELPVEAMHERRSSFAPVTTGPGSWRDGRSEPSPMVTLPSCCRCISRG
jgi:hypothetical protein